MSAFDFNKILPYLGYLLDCLRSKHTIVEYIKRTSQIKFDFTD